MKVEDISKETLNLIKTKIEVRLREKGFTDILGVILTEAFGDLVCMCLREEKQDGTVVSMSIKNVIGKEVEEIVNHCTEKTIERAKEIWNGEPPIAN